MQSKLQKGNILVRQMGGLQVKVGEEYSIESRRRKKGRILKGSYSFLDHGNASEFAVLVSISVKHRGGRAETEVVSS